MQGTTRGKMVEFEELRVLSERGRPEGLRHPEAPPHHLLRDHNIASFRSRAPNDQNGYSIATFHSRAPTDQNGKGNDKLSKKLYGLTIQYTESSAAILLLSMRRAALTQVLRSELDRIPRRVIPVRRVAPSDQLARSHSPG